MMKVSRPRHLCRILSPMVVIFSLLLLVTGCGGPDFSKIDTAKPTVNITASATSIAAGGSSTLTVTATNASAVTVTGSDGSSYSMSAGGGTKVVTPAATTTYTASATGTSGNASATVTVTVAAPGKPTVNMVAAPTSIAPGDSSTLTVTATNASTVTVTGTDGSSYKLSSSGGTQVVKPTATTTYTATANGTAAGDTVTAKAVVTVTAEASLPTVTIAANPASVTAGSASTLTVVAANASQVTVTGSDGSSYALGATGGTQSVSPTATTTYTATATGPGGTATPAVTTVTVVSVAAAPTVTIAANPASITAGSSSTLTVVAGNASQVTVTGSDGSNYALSSIGGTQAVTPTVTTTYTATATGPGGNITAATTVTVVAGPPPAAPTVSIAANPATITAGSNSTLTVVATNATAVTVTGSDGSSTTTATTGGTLTVQPAASTTYTATATGAGGTITATATVTVVAAPPPVGPTVTLSANPTSITAGGSTTLTVAAANATTVVLTGTDGSTVELPVTGGTEAVTPNQTSTYTVTATGVTGTTPATATIIVTVTQPPGPTVTIAANPQSIASGSSSVLTVTATNATAVTITGTDGSSYPLATSGGTQTVTPTQTTTYSVTADGSGGTAPATASATVTVVAPGSVKSINHVVFMLQENHTFDSYFGMLNPYRQSKGLDIGDDGNTYEVDGIDDKLATITNKDKQGVAHKLYRLKSTCIDDASSAWTESFGDESLGSFLTTRPILVNGFVSNADGFATSKNDSGAPGYTDLSGDRAMGYYDEGFLNYYYYMASQFGLSDRWFSPMSSKSIPNRIATFTGGTTQGLTQDPSSDDHLNQLGINNIFQKLDKAGVSWRVYYTVNNGECIDPEDCKKSGSALYPASTFSYLTYSYKYLYGNPKAPSASGCVAPASPSSAVGDSSNTFCIDTDKIAPLSQYFTDLANGTLPSFSFIESGSGVNDEHPGYQQSILIGQAQVAKIVNALMSSTSWKDSVFFLGYDEGGGPYDHVPPVPNHSNDKTTSSKLASYPIDIGKVAVNPGDGFNPCVPQTSDGSATLHCDLRANQPGANSGDAAAVNGFAAQLGFRVPNFVISPFTRKHYVSHTPMDHTAVIKFVEDRFIGDGKYLTARDAAQPNLLDFFDFDNTPWATPPAPPAPVSSSTLGYNPCTPAQMK